jgi:hypothetical protein
MISVNNRLILEEYKKGSLKAKVLNGIATPDQRDGFKGLKVLMSTTLSDGRFIPAGSIAYIREEILHSHPWASKSFSCDTFPARFIVVDLQHIDFFDNLNPAPDTA